MTDANDGASLPDGNDPSSSADIISFPGRFRRPTDATARLGQAIRDLHQANAELRDKIAGWRAVTNELKVSLGKIATSMQVVDTRLTMAGSQLQRSGVEQPTSI